MEESEKALVLRDNALGHAALCRVLLDPLAWQSVGKMRGWHEREEYLWRLQWHRFIDQLADGKPIDAALTRIS